jgi:hypothetical protein
MPARPLGERLAEPPSDFFLSPNHAQAQWLLLYVIDAMGSLSQT